MLSIINADVGVCGATTCALMNVGCNTLLSHADVDNLAIDSSTGAVTYDRSIVAGYGPVVFCVRCKNTGDSGGVGIIDHDTVSL